MALRKCDAIVLRRIPFRNSSLVVSLLAREEGLLDTIAKGCRRPASPLRGRIDLWNRGELVYYEKQSALHIVSQFDPEYEPVALRRHPVAFGAAALMGEMALYASLPAHPAPELFDLLVAGLAYLESLRPAWAGSAAFALAVLRASGFEPALAHCALCGGFLEGETLFLAPDRGGVACAACGPAAAAAPLPPPVLAALRFLARSGLAGAHRLALGPALRRETLDAALSLVTAQFGRPLAAASFFARFVEEEDLRHAS